MGVFTFNYLNKNIPKTQEINSVELITLDEISKKVKDTINLKNYDQYIEQAIKINGKLKEIKKHQENYTLILSSQNNTINIICKMQKDQIQKINELQIGKNITIKGIYKGHLIDMILLNCILI